MKYQGITKLIYKFYYKIKCPHYIYAVLNKLTPQINNLEITTLETNISNYFDITEIIKNNDTELPDFVKYFQKLSIKLKNNYFDNFDDQELWIKDFEVNVEGLFAVIDFIKFNHLKKEIEFRIIKHSIYKANKIMDNKFLDLEYLYFILATKYPHYKLTFVLILLLPLNHQEKKSGIITIKDIENKFMLNQKQPADFLWNQILLGVNKIEINNYKSKFIELNLSFIMKNQLIAIKTRLENLKIILNYGGLKFILPKWLKEYNPRLFTKCVICFAARKKSKIYDHYQLDKVSKLLSGYGKKLAMIDFETINDPQPNIIHYLPYDRIVVQISMHLMKKNQIVDHYEYIVKDLSLNELMKIANILLIAQNKGYNFVAYNKVFENSCINKMNSILNTKINNVNLDLADFFVKRSIKKEKKAPISLISFGFSFSIKATINYYSSINPYQNLKVNNGFDAMAKLYNYIVEKDMSIDLKTLYKYCKQDTKTMVDLYNKINYEYHLYVTGQKPIIKSNFPFENPR